MRGMQILSALLKVNPFFTIALAMGFTGVAGVGLNHVDSIALKKLIPLHIKSFFAGDPPRAGTDIPDFEIAQHTMQQLLPWSERPGASGNVTSNEPAFVLPAPARLTWASFPKVPAQPTAFMPVPSQTATPSPADLGPDQPASKTDQAMAGNPSNAYSAPHSSDDPSGAATPNYPNFSFPMAPQRFSARAPAIAPSLIVPPTKQAVTPVEEDAVKSLITPPMIEQTLPSLADKPLGPILDIPPYAHDLPVTNEPVVVTPEPPLHLLFAGSLAILVGLRYRASRDNSAKIASN